MSLDEMREAFHVTYWPEDAGPAYAGKPQHYMNCSGNQQYPMSNDPNCTCGLHARVALQTEREMHKAWRKRAEEAEAALESLPRMTEEEIVNILVQGYMHAINSEGKYPLTDVCNAIQMRSVERYMPKAARALITKFPHLLAKEK